MIRVNVDPCRSVSMSIRVSPCQIQGWPFSTKKSAAASLLAATGLVKSRDGHFHRKKSACGKIPISNRACQIQRLSFSRKKSACGKIPISNRACQIQGWSFSPKKSACSKLVSSNRACQSPDYGCAMDFCNHKVSFRSDGTPLHRIAVQF